MEGGARWRTARTVAEKNDTSVIDLLMLRFRPIAPKPVIGDSISGKVNVGNDNVIFSKVRKKRKYVRVRENNRLKREKREERVLTLQLLPEETDRKGSSSGGGGSRSDVDSGVSLRNLVIHENYQDHQDRDLWLKFNDMARSDLFDLTARTREMTVVETTVTVEFVTEPCMDVLGLGCTDVEVKENLDRDTCPGFVSDGCNKVRWVNRAYMSMVSRQKEGSTATAPAIVVRLVTKEKLREECSAFTCQVKMEYTWQNQKSVKIVPCDGWRLDGGGFAWRLDVKAALSLGI